MTTLSVIQIKGRHKKTLNIVLKIGFMTTVTTVTALYIYCRVHPMTMIFPLNCYYCDYKPDSKDHYERHVILRHDHCLAYPNKVEIEKRAKNTRQGLGDMIRYRGVIKHQNE
jgi:hypothetical protein